MRGGSNNNLPQLKEYTKYLLGVYCKVYPHVVAISRTAQKVGIPH